MTFKELLTKWHGKYRGASTRLSELTGKSDTIISFLVNNPNQPVSPELIKVIAKAMKLPELAVAECFPQLNQRNAIAHGVSESGKRYLPPELTQSSIIPQMIPFFGSVCAGGANFSFDAMPESYLPLYMPAPKGRRLGSWLVQGDCMDDGGVDAIHQGDTIIVVEQDYAESGKIVIAMLDGEITLKKLLHYNDVITLQPKNPKHAPIKVTTQNFKILGVVIGSFRRL